MLEAKRAVAVDRAYYHYRCYEGSVTKHFSFHIPESYEKSNAALDELLAALPELVQPGDCVLVKASHSMAFERIVQALTQD